MLSIIKFLNTPIRGANLIGYFDYFNINISCSNFLSRYQKEH